MWPFKQSPWKYSPAMKDEADDDYDLSKPLTGQPRCTSSKSSRWCGIVAAVLIAVVCLIVGFESGVFLLSHGVLAKWHGYQQPAMQHTHAHTGTCKSPKIRREWRSLSMREKHNYLDAVQCLAHTPSGFAPNMTLYDDFPHIHDTIGAMCTFPSPENTQETY
jgi:hypothetical protein